jgi:Tol biopolymer transport system component
MRRQLKLTIWCLCGLLSLAALDATGTHGNHPRPRGATPMRISLAVAYRSCTPPTQTEPIVFQSNRDSNDEIYSMNEDGSGQTRLTNNPADDFRPSWSPGGDKIAFTSNRDGNNEIYTMNADGTGVTNLTNNPANDRQPSWTSDGGVRHIVFTSDRTGNDEVFVMNESGNALGNLTQSAGQDNNPNSWGHQLVAFQSDRDGNAEIYTTPGGVGATRLTVNAAHDGGPAWTASDHILFDSDRDGNSEIYSMNSTGGSQGRLTNNAAVDSSPAGAPDTKIAFETNRDGDFEIYSMNSDGTGQTNLTNNSTGDDRSPDFVYVPLPNPQNRQHGPPLDVLSCNPPQQESSYLTVGTGDAWPGTTPQLFGSLRFDVKPTAPEDLLIKASITDVRCRSDSAPGFCSNQNGDNAGVPDYAGTLHAVATTRLTDHDNCGPSLSCVDSGTAQDLDYGFDIPCATTPVGVGSTCALATSANTLVPGTVPDSKRMNWQFSQARVLDGGADGQGSTLADDEEFLRQGIWVP